MMNKLELILLKKRIEEPLRQIVKCWNGGFCNCK